MSNPLFQLLGGGQMPNNMQNMLRQFQQFQSSFRGDPRQQIQQLMNSGRISQADYNKAVQMANQFRSLFNK